MVALTALSRAEFPELRDGAAFRRFIADRHTWSVEVEHRGGLASFEQMLWKWLRCELSHRGSLPVDVQLFQPDDAPDDLRIRAGGPPDYCVRLSDGWYWWLRRLAQDQLDSSSASTAEQATLH